MTDLVIHSDAIQTVSTLTAEAQNRATWAWADVMIGFNEVGYDPSTNEKERILKRLVRKKLIGLLNKHNISYTG